jgi:hypothetical protein
MSDIVDLQTFPSKIDADLAQARLESSGIRAFVSDPPYPAMFLAEGVKLRVASRDEQRARGVLQELAEELRSEVPFEDSDTGGETVRCPQCELDYCYFQRPVLRGLSPGGAAALPTVLATVFLWFMKKRWTCHKCGHVWDDPHEGPERVTPLPAGVPKPVFRLRRANPGVGLVVGGMAGLFSLPVLAGLSPPLALLAFLPPVLGWFIGSRYVKHVCSEPTCRSRLRSSHDRCPECNGQVVGVIESAAEHFVAAADYRKSLALKKRSKRRKKRKDQVELD